MATLPGHNLFSSLPSPAFQPSGDSSSRNRRHTPPIPIPKYPPKPKSKPLRSKSPPKSHPGLRIPHRNTKFYKPIRGDEEKIILPSESDGDAADRAVVIGESGVSYLLPDAPFVFQFSYSETPKVKPLAIREPAFLPFAPPSMPRPWTGKAPLKGKREKEMKKNKIPLFDSFNPPPPGKNGVKYVEMPGPYKLGQYPKESRSREEILGEPLSKAEIKMLIQPHLASNRQVNLGRDGLIHNMLDLVHTHWKRRRVCKVRCRGVPTVDMDNVCKHLEEKTGGKIIHRAGGVVYLFRGRNYNYRTRPEFPMMLWKPATPVYPKLIQAAPEGLTKEEADELRKKGTKLKPICKLAKNGIYTSLVNDVRHAFEGSILVKIDCRGLEPSDYKKVGAKLKDLVPCVLLSFDDEQILMWRGHDWKSIYPEPPIPSTATEIGLSNSELDDDNDSHIQKSETTTTSPRMMSLWKRAINSNKAILLDETKLGPDALLEKVEEFERVNQATEHSYPAVVLSGRSPAPGFRDRQSFLGTETGEESFSENEDSDDFYGGEYDDPSEEDPFEEAESNVPLGSLPVDLLAKRLQEE
ncbi:hypothetical protein V2J09_015442 [Rumex salicifolius]